MGGICFQLENSLSPSDSLRKMPLVEHNEKPGGRVYTGQLPVTQVEKAEQIFKNSGSLFSTQEQE